MDSYNKQYRNINIYSIEKFEDLSDMVIQLGFKIDNVKYERNFKNL